MDSSPLSKPEEQCPQCHKAYTFRRSRICHKCDSIHRTEKTGECKRCHKKDSLVSRKLCLDCLTEYLRYFTNNRACPLCHNLTTLLPCGVCDSHLKSEEVEIWHNHGRLLSITQSSLTSPSEYYGTLKKSIHGCFFT